jgi:hypothetical protein
MVLSDSYLNEEYMMREIIKLSLYVELRTA